MKRCTYLLAVDFPDVGSQWDLQNDDKTMNFKLVSALGEQCLRLQLNPLSDGPRECR